MTVEKTIELSDEKTYESVFEELQNEINKINLEQKQGKAVVKEGADRKKSEAIIRSARQLKAIKVKEGKSTNTICDEITKCLRGSISSSLVRKCLGPEFKVRYRSENAGKRNAAKRIPKEIDGSAVILPLNQNERTKQELSVDKLNDKYANAVQPISTINETINNLPVHEDLSHDQSVRIEFPLDIQLIQRYVATLDASLSDQVKVWLHVEFEKKTGSVISVGLGRSNQNENQDRIGAGEQ